MKICKQGNGHYLNGINNQDYCYMEKNLKLITDGCSQGEYSETGTRLFVQLFSSLEDPFNINLFEENVEKVFSQMLSLVSSKDNEAEANFITDNMLFTIVACFELEDKFIVKYIGDGYIITVNKQDMVSYIRLFYGKRPPYYAYNKLNTKVFSETLKFKTFEFSKEHFKNVGIASDGFMPIAEKKIPENIEACILGKNTIYTVEGIIKTYQNSFYDDVTVLI